VTSPRTLAPGRTVPTERPIVAVFGSSTLTRGEAPWAVAHELGERLAAAGLAVMNGGYAGAMEAVSEGAAKGGAPVIGVTTSLFNHRPANPHLSHREDTSTLLERLDYLVHVASAFVVLEGSVGTMAELFLTWNLLAVDGRAAAPLAIKGTTGESYRPSYSPDGVWITFTLRHEGRNDVHAVEVKTGQDVALTTDGKSWNSVFSPDGRQIAFLRESGGLIDLYAMDVAEVLVGGPIHAAVKLTRGEGIDGDSRPAWGR